MCDFLSFSEMLQLLIIWLKCLVKKERGLGQIWKVLECSHICIYIHTYERILLFSYYFFGLLLR